MSNEIDKKFFEQIFAHTLIKLADKLINTKNKKENQIIVFFLCMYKMYLISAKGYKNAYVGFLATKTTSEIWVNMKDAGSGMGVKTYLI